VVEITRGAPGPDVSTIPRGADASPEAKVEGANREQMLRSNTQNRTMRVLQIVLKMNQGSETEINV
jgi:hypothetical protein